MHTILLLAGSLSWSGSALAAAPTGWTCEPAAASDEICDCGCGVADTACPDNDPPFVECERTGCGDGEVPWEHRPWTCMVSACGDGWRDERTSEACDDGDALRGGGCNRDCSAVNEGWECGERAEGCWEVEVSTPTDTGTEPTDTDPTGGTDSTETDTGEPDDGGSGCTTSQASGLPWLSVALLLLLRRRRD